MPADESQLIAFLGTAGYYRQFVPNYAHIASPLHRACQKGDRFRWAAECEEAFLHIKRKLTNTLILAFPQLDVPFILDSDASGSGLGAVLSQVQCGKERVIGSLSTCVFETRTATGSELFSLLNCLYTTTFTLLSIFSPLEMISVKIWESPLPCHAKCSVPVVVCVSKTRVLKLPTSIRSARTIKG